MNEQKPEDRIKFKGNLDVVFEDACIAYGLDSFVSFSVVTMGYEDYNAVISTQSGKYFAKVFAEERTLDDINRYVDIIEATISNGVNHPRLTKSANGPVYHHGESSLSMIFMEYIDGKTLFELDRVPNEEESAAIIRQVVAINKTKHHPPFIYDTWSINNISNTYSAVEANLEESDKNMIKSIIEELKLVEESDLPHCLVHGDIIKSNVMLCSNKIYVLDFSVANWYPRVYEIAVLVGSLFNSAEPKESLESLLSKVTSLYKEAGGELTEGEVALLPIYVKASYAMEFLGACRMKFVEGNESSENEYWLNLGRESMIRTNSL